MISKKPLTKKFSKTPKPTPSKTPVVKKTPISKQNTKKRDAMRESLTHLFTEHLEAFRTFNSRGNKITIVTPEGKKYFLYYKTNCTK